MGTLIYGVAPAIRIDDWGLHHLEMVMLTKLRRDESFRFSWDDEPDVDGDVALDSSAESGQHGTVWISRSSSLYFSYTKPLDRPLNRAWIHELVNAANGNNGLRLLPEPT